MSDDPFANICSDALLEFRPKKLPPKILWHYTSSDGLKGIVDHNCLWFTDACFQNDGSEINYGLNLLQLIANKYVPRLAEEDQPEIQLLLDEVANQLNFHRVIVFCLCEKPNLLNQWRDYGKDVVPYCIGLDPIATQQCSDPDFYIFLKDIIYDAATQTNILRRMIDRSIEASQKIENPDTLSDAERKSYRTKAAQQFALAIMQFKNPAFSAEQEWRFVAHQTDMPPSVETQFRTSTLGVIPYFHWRPDKENPVLPIKEVIVGPSPYGAVSQGALRQFLDARGYGHAVLSHSTIPIRR